MISRVATFSVSSQMIDAAMRTESAMANEQLQEASGQISTDYAGLGSTSTQVVNLQVSFARSQSYVANATSADSKVQVMYSTVTSVTSLYTQLRTLLTGASSAASTNSASVAASAQQMLQEMSSLMNTQYSGQYLFGGSNTGTAPVNVSSSVYPALTSPSSVATSYYQGDNQLASVRVSDGAPVSYGVTAANPAFEQGLRALNLVANNSPLSTSTLDEALDLVTSALNSAETVQAQLGIASSTIQNASANQTDYQGFVQTVASDLTNVDVASVTAQLSNYQTELTASYSAIAKIQGLSLASYIH